MKKLQFKIVINALVNKVFDLMLGISNKSTYEQWTALFNPTSTYEGNWEKGSKMLFIGIDEQGEKGGMVSENDGKSIVAVDIDFTEEFADYMNGVYPKALSKLKEICEE
jgi:hypothetical protein